MGRGGGGSAGGSGGGSRGGSAGGSRGGSRGGSFVGSGGGSRRGGASSSGSGGGRGFSSRRSSSGSSQSESSGSRSASHSSPPYGGGGFRSGGFGGGFFGGGPGGPPPPHRPFWGPPPPRHYWGPSYGYGYPNYGCGCIVYAGLCFIAVCVFISIFVVIGVKMKNELPNATPDTAVVADSTEDGSKALHQVIQGKNRTVTEDEPASREKLAADACIHVDEMLDDRLDWFTDTETVEQAMEYFYETTGVQPYLLICDSLEGKGEEITDEEAEQYLQQLYDSLYTDEGHLIFVFMEYAESEYIMYLYAGTEANRIIDESAREKFLDNVDAFYTDSSLSDEEYFAKIFRVSADDIMN